MPSKLSVCITGANGFVGSHVVRVCLERGHKVVAIVRAPLTPIRVDHFSDFTDAGERLRIVTGDVLDSVGLDDAMRDCSAVIHTATNVTLWTRDPQREIVDVALRGTQNTLDAAKRNGVARFVLTSSESAILRYDKPDDYVFNNLDWADDATVANNPYGVAKRDSERLMWSFCERHPGLQATAIHPGLVLGPLYTAQHRRSSVSVLFDVLNRTHPGFAPMWHNIVDAQSVALAHVLALETPQAVGRRLPVSIGGMWWREIAETLAPHYAVHRRELPRFMIQIAAALDPRVSWRVLKPMLGRPFLYDAQDTPKILGFAYPDVADMIIETARTLVDAGYAPRARRR